MGTYYTLDSTNRLFPFAQIFKWSLEPKEPELAAFLHQMYPDGLSMHGQNYLYNPDPKIDDDNGISKSLTAGLIFELVRRSHFPDKPSRYQSLFACQHLSEVRRFGEMLADEKKNEQIRTAPVYEVITNGPVHRGDMNLFDADCSVLEFYRRAYLYWSGEPAPVKGGEEENNPLWELLIPLPAVIGRRITEQQNSV